MERIDYMRAWVRLNTQTDIIGWSDEEVVTSFSILPLPAKSFGEWCAMANTLLEVDEQPQEVADRGDPVERLKREGHHLFKAGIVRLGA